MDSYWKFWKNADKLLLAIAASFAIVSILIITSISLKNGQLALRDIIVQSVAYGLGFFAMAAMVILRLPKI